MINRQTQILAEMKEGLLNGYYDQKLPKTTELAQEFGVNDKTMNRVMLRLVKLPFISRKHKGETTVLKNRNLPPVIEFIYEAAQNIENHLYWMSVCQGLMSAFSAKNITLKLNQLVIQQNRMIDLDCSLTRYLQDW